jgi:hypothetical protein
VAGRKENTAELTRSSEHYDGIWFRLESEWDLTTWQFQFVLPERIRNRLQRTKTR